MAMMMSRVLMMLCLAAAIPLASAQSWGPLNLEELKAETQRRADRNLPPIGGVRPEDAREAMAQLKTLEPDVWAGVWGAIGDRYFARAKEVEKTDPKEARELYYKAWDNFNVGRWPTEKNSPGKMKVYQKALDAFRNYGRLMDPPLETVRIPFEGKEIVAYLRLPAGVRPAPIVFGINGLDSRKEDVIARVDSYLRAGVGVFAIDMPGTGEAPLLIDVGAERMF